ncbi:MAG: AAA family ATPase [Saprospiraceae bacterium]|nr:AAA family ATPase [Saprospiraceae bacterium]
MLVRFTVSNFLSFKDSTEFNMLTGNPRRLEHHVYEPVKGLALLKMAAVYGANGAGKSNLVKAMAFMRDLLRRGWQSPAGMQYKLDASLKGKASTFEVEMVCEGATYLYGFDLLPASISEEWLYRTQVGKPDEIVFHRYTQAGKTQIKVADTYLQTPEQQLRIQLYEQEILKDTETLLQVLASSKAPIGPVQAVHRWITNSWIVLFPYSHPLGLVWDFISNPAFFRFAKEIMCTFHTGIHDIQIDTQNLKDFFGQDDPTALQRIESDLAKAESAGGSLSIRNAISDEEILILRENGSPVVKRIVPLHRGQSGELIPFTIFQESDGTRRLLELVPAFFGAIQGPGTIIIDEIEQTIHPVLLRELVSKFTMDTQTKGQLVFTTHEAHLLDQEFMRQDEFWFAEKSPEGATSFTPLSDFKDVRYDLDLRKGYLLGRFGAIPSTGDLRHFNWDAYAEAELQ